MSVVRVMRVVVTDHSAVVALMNAVMDAGKVKVVTQSSRPINNCSSSVPSA